MSIDDPYLMLMADRDRLVHMSAKPRTKPTMSDEHKAALAEGRNQGRAVRNYLDALESHRPKRGRKRTRESIDTRLEAIEAEIGTANSVKRLQLIQERLDLTAERDADTEVVDLTELEAAFVAAAKPYSERKGISYAAWRELGVPAPTLKAAGITRAAN